MSLKKTAASTPCRRTGCRVISATRSGRMQDSSMGMPSRSFRYSGSERPAWRMNHTGRVRHGLAPAGADEGGISGLLVRTHAPASSHARPSRMTAPAVGGGGARPGGTDGRRGRGSRPQCGPAGASVPPPGVPAPPWRPAAQ